MKWYENAMVCLATNFESVESKCWTILTKLEETCYCDTPNLISYVTPIIKCLFNPKRQTK